MRNYDFWKTKNKNVIIGYPKKNKRISYQVMLCSGKTIKSFKGNAFHKLMHGVRTARKVTTKPFVNIHKAEEYALMVAKSPFL